MEHHLSRTKLLESIFPIMKRSNRLVLTALFFLLLIVGDEAIKVHETVASQQRLYLLDARTRKGSHALQRRWKALKESKDHIEAQCHGNSAVCTERKDEILLLQVFEGIHSACGTRLTKDCLALSEVVYRNDVPMNRDTIEKHQQEASALIEKSFRAMTRWGRAKNFFGGKDAEEKANSEEAVAIGDLFSLEGIGEVEAAVDGGKNGLGFMDVAGSIVYGVANGFFSGMMDDFRDAFADETCTDTAALRGAFKTLCERAADLWDTYRGALKHVWTDSGRDQLVDTLKGAFSAFSDLVSQVFRFVVTCKGTQLILIMSAIMAVAIAVNFLALLAGNVVALAVKIGLVLLEIVTSVPYLKGLVVRGSKELKKVIAGTCAKDCLKMFIQIFAEVLGFVMQAVLLSGDVKDVLKVLPKPGAQVGPFKWSRKFLAPVEKFLNLVKSARDGKGIRPAMFKVANKAIFGIKTVTKRTKQLVGNGKPTPKARSAGVDASTVAKSADDADVKVVKSKDGDSLLSGGKAGANTGGKGTAENPMAWAEGKQFNDQRKYAFDKYTDDVPTEMLRQQDNFAGGKFNKVVVKPDKSSDEIITLYRAGNKHDPKSGKAFMDDATGGYWTRDPPTGEFGVRGEAAVKMEWNKLDTVYKVEIPVKDLKDPLVMYEGKVGMQGASDGLHKGMKYQGGGDQIYLDVAQFRGTPVPRSDQAVLKSRFRDDGLFAQRGIKVEDIGYAGAQKAAGPPTEGVVKAAVPGSTVSTSSAHNSATIVKNAETLSSAGSQVKNSLKDRSGDDALPGTTDRDDGADDSRSFWAKFAERVRRKQKQKENEDSEDLQLETPDEEGGKEEEKKDKSSGNTNGPPWAQSGGMAMNYRGGAGMSRLGMYT
jgi:hypothetical protein